MNIFKNLHLRVYFLVSIFFLLSGFIITNSINYFVKKDIESIALNSVYHETALRSKLVKNKIYALINHSIIRSYSGLKDPIYEKLIYESKKSNYVIYYKFANDILSSDKLIQKDLKKFLTKESQKKLNIENLKKLKKYLDVNFNKFKLSKDEKIKFINISDSIDKATILFIQNKSNHKIFKIFLSEIFDESNFSIYFKEEIICDFNGNILYHSNKGKSVLKDNIVSDEYFLGLNETKTDSITRKIYDKGIPLISSAYIMRDFKLIYILNHKEDVYLEEIERMKQRNIFIAMFMFIIAEILLFITFKIIYKKGNI